VQVKSNDATGGNTTSAPPSSFESPAAKPDNAPPVTSGNDATRPTTVKQETEKPAGMSQDSTIKPTSADSRKPQNSQVDSKQSSSRKPKTTKAQATAESQPVANAESVEGFTINDISALLREANAAAGRGDYKSARYDYGIILRLDRQNTEARKGLVRVQEAEKEKN
jgi:hypothetical protein